MKHLHRKSIGNKTSSDIIILVKPFRGTSTKAMKYVVSPDLEKNLDLLSLAATTLNLLIHLKRSPMKFLHYFYP